MFSPTQRLIAGFRRGINDRITTLTLISDVDMPSAVIKDAEPWAALCHTAWAESMKDVSDISRVRTYTE